MIGAVVYKLRAENSGRLSLINGRLMHAAFFKILNEFAPALEKFIHNELTIKPFTVSFLDPAKKIPSVSGHWQVRRGDEFFWRITGLNEEILRAILSVPLHQKVQVGALSLTVENATDDIIAIEDFILSVKNIPSVSEICFEFVSPVTFRIDNFDAPYPRAELIFASLADKWSQAAMPAAVDKKVIRELAAKIRLTEWTGQSKKFYFGHDRGTLAFWGKFLYSVDALNDSVQKVFLLLAKFGEFAGVGRLTGQGFGQVRVDFDIYNKNYSVGGITRY